MLQKTQTLEKKPREDPGFKFQAIFFVKTASSRCKGGDISKICLNESLLNKSADPRLTQGEVLA